MLYGKGPHHHQLSPAGIEGKLEKNSGGYSARTPFYFDIFEVFLMVALNISLEIGLKYDKKDQ